jgi:hypothetical protein
VQRRDTTTTAVLLRDNAEIVRWPLALACPPGLSDVDNLARLQLAARRLGCSIRLHGVSPDLWELLDLAGLARLIGVGGPGGLVVEVGGEAERGEQPSVEEGVVPGDPRA